MKDIYNVGYAFGVFDIVDVEHLDHLEQARRACDFLFVGVLSDEASSRHTGTAPVNPFDERLQIVRSMRSPDAVVGQFSNDLTLMWRQLQFSTLLLDDTMDDRSLHVDLREALDVVRVSPSRRSVSSLVRGSVQG